METHQSPPLRQAPEAFPHAISAANPFCSHPVCIIPAGKLSRPFHPASLPRSLLPKLGSSHGKESQRDRDLRESPGAVSPGLLSQLTLELCPSAAALGSPGSRCWDKDLRVNGLLGMVPGATSESMGKVRQEGRSRQSGGAGE